MPQRRTQIWRTKTDKRSLAKICRVHKIRNKMVQILVCERGCNSVGCHWKDWVCQQGTRLASARHKSSHRELTRAEVTFCIDESIPTDEFINEILHNIVKYTPASLIYSTLFSKVWPSYCDTFHHSFVCIDRIEDVGLVVYSSMRLPEMLVDNTTKSTASMKSGVWIN